MESSYSFMVSLLTAALVVVQICLASTETKLTHFPPPSKQIAEDLNTAAGSSMYPYSLGTGNPLASLALLASPPPPTAFHPLLLATLMGGAPILPPAAATPAAAAAAAASIPQLAYIGAGQGHNPLLAYLLAQYARYGPYGAVNYSLPGYSASNNVHNSKAFGGYKYEDRT